MKDLAIRILAAPNGSAHMFALGQAGFVLKSGKGTLLGIDMCLTDCVERFEGHDGFKRLLPKVLDPADLTFDYVIATHPHYDHFDMDAIPILLGNGHTHLYASTNCKREVERLMLTDAGSKFRIHYVGVGDEAQLDDIHVDFVFCDHGEGAPDAVGLVIRIDDSCIYCAGDTCLRLDKVDELQKYGPFDYMIAPINGAFGNLNEQECIQLTSALKPGCVIPCHYGMFASHGGSPGVFRDRITKSLPLQKYLLMAPGEMVGL